MCACVCVCACGVLCHLCAFVVRVSFVRVRVRVSFVRVRVYHAFVGLPLAQDALAARALLKKDPTLRAAVNSHFTTLTGHKAPGYRSVNRGEYIRCDGL